MCLYVLISPTLSLTTGALEWSRCFAGRLGAVSSEPDRETVDAAVATGAIAAEADSAGGA